MRGQEVKELQEFLWLHPEGVKLDIDSDFGPATSAAVRVFQSNLKLPITGKVEERTMRELRMPMTRARKTVSPEPSYGATVVKVALQHFQEHPQETPPFHNTGPWVRLYMGGNDGAPWLWCAGFVSYILRQAASAHGTKPPYSSFSTDKILQKAKETEHFLAHGGEDPKPGDVFLLVKKGNPNDAFHTGIVLSVHRESVFTIEGNTNEGGSRNGIEVARRVRRRKETLVFATI